MSACPVADLESKKQQQNKPVFYTTVELSLTTVSQLPRLNQRFSDSPAQRRVERQKALALDLQQNALNMIFQGMIYNSMSAGTRV